MNDLKKVREAKGLTQGDLAILSGVNRTLISLYENGYAVPSERHKAAIANALDSEIDFRLKTAGEILSAARA